MKKINLFSRMCSPRVGSQKDEGSSRLRVVFDSFTCRLRVCPLKLVSVLAILLTIGVGQVRAVDPPTLSDLSFGDPLVQENFNNVSATSTTSRISNIATSQTNYGEINSLYNNDTGGSNTIAVSTSGNNMTSNYFSLTQGTTKQLIAQITGKSFTQSGAWRITVEKTSHAFFGLYNDASNTSAFDKAKVSAFLQNSAGTITLQNGTSKSNWEAVGSATSNTIDICVIYNLTDKSVTYGGSISLGSMKAHVYINGTCVNSAGTPTAFTLQNNGDVKAFRVSSNGSGDHVYVDDIKVYSTLPTAAASCAAPSAPSNGSVTASGATISTSSSSANYDIYYSTSSTTPTTQDPTATITSGNSKAITGLNYGTTYYYWMRKNCGGGSTSSWVAGSPASFTTLASAPTSITAGSISSSGATFTIVDSYSPASYDIYYSDNSTAPVAGTSATTTSDSKTKSVTGLSSSTKYYYWVRGVGANAKSSWVSGGNFTTLTPCTAAPTVTDGSKGTITSTTAVVNCSSGISSLGTGGCAIESYGFVYGTSSNPTTSNSTAQVGTTYTTTGTSFNATLTSLTEGTTYYVRPYATNGSGTNYGAQTSFSTPKITVSTTSVAFGDKGVDATTGYTATFTVSGTYLQSDISIAKSGTNEGMFTIDETSVSQTSGTAASTTITVTYKPSTAASHSATLTLTSTNATSKTVTLSGTGKWTVTFLNGTGGTHSTALVANSTAPSKPGSDPSACDATSTTFVGWTQTAWSGKKPQSYVDALTAANVKVYTSSDNLPAMTDDVTYYPVFAKATGTPSDEWGLVTSTSGLSAGDKIVIANAPSGTIYVMGKDTVTDKGFQFRRVAQVSSFTVSSNKITISTIASSSTDRNNPHAMTVGKSGDYWTFYDPLKSAYLSCVSTSDKNSLGYETTLSDAGKWALSFSSNQATIVSQISSDITTRNYLQANGAPFGTGSSFTCVANTQTDPSIFKNLSTVSYSDYLTTCCDKNITIGDPDITGTGTVAFSVGGSALAVDDVVETCSAAKNIVVRVTPGSGYECTSLSFSDGTNTLTPSPTTASTLPFGYDEYKDFTLSFSKETTSITLETEVEFSAKALTGWSWKYKKGADAANDGVDPYTIPETVEVYKNEYARFFIVGYDPEDVIDSKKGFVYVSSDDPEVMQPVFDKSELSYSSKNAACSYYQLYGKKVVESSTITFKSAGNASLTKTFTLKVKELPSVTFVDLIHNKTDFTNWGTDGVVSSTVTTGVVTHVKPTPTHTDLTEPATGNSCEKTHLHLIGWIRSDYSKVADYMNGTGSEPTVSELTGAGTGYWFTPGADINIETYNGKTFYAVWAVEE